MYGCGFLPKNTCQDAMRVQKAERKRRHEQVRPFPGTYETPG